jgi:hypothetical protein
MGSKVLHKKFSLFKNTKLNGFRDLETRRSSETKRDWEVQEFKNLEARENLENPRISEELRVQQPSPGSFAYASTFMLGHLLRAPKIESDIIQTGISRVERAR